MDEIQFHNKIIWFTFLFSLLVVWIHSYNSQLFLGITYASMQVYVLEHAVGDGIGQLAVPGFFMISAYLFYRNFAYEKLKAKWKSRIRSILVPYLVWNAIYYIGYVIGSRLPIFTDIMNKGRIPFTLQTAVDAILHYTYNYVFWYLYQLILLIILAPLIYMMLRHTVIGFLFLTALWVGLVMRYNLPQLNLDAAFYYCVAAYLALHGRQWVEGTWNIRRCLVGIGLLMGAYLSYRWNRSVLYVWPFVLTRIFGVMGLWLSVSELWLHPAAEWMKYNFFLYATHFVFVRIINKTMAMLLPHNMIVTILLYFLMPVIVLTISNLLGWILRNYMRPVWNLLCGGRA